MKKLLAVFALLPILASCNSVVDDPFLRTGAVKGDWPSLATTAGPEHAVAALPGLVATTVRQTGGKGGLEQTIVYANSTDLAGENMLTVAIGKSEAGKGAPSRSQVEAEMRVALSGVRMQISPLIADNAYGAFGYATGTAGKDGSCVYAWQFARSATQFGGGIIGSGDPARIRLRYCSASMTSERIVALMQGLRLNPAGAGSAAVPQAFAPAALAVAEPFVDQKMQTAANVEPVRRTVKRVVWEKAATEAEKSVPSIVNAVKVPLPSETVAFAGSDATVAAAKKEVSGTVAKPSFVPLPETVVTTAQ